MLNESEIKYLAGLSDADGSLSIKFTENRYGQKYFHLMLEISAAVGYDRNGYLQQLSEQIGSCNIKTYENPNHQDAYIFRIQSRKDLNLIMPRLIKHMVIKGAHWKRLYDKYIELQGVQLTDQQVEELRVWSSESRKKTGPVKDKSRPTWAWVAGYLDGDGSYQLPKSGTVLIQVKAHVDDTCGIELLQKAFGGTIYTHKDPNTKIWQITMGRMNRSRAMMFLPQVLKHSRFKRWKIEQMIAFHNRNCND